MALQEWRRQSEVEHRAMADNVWFEERMDDARRIAFESDAVIDPGTMPLKDLIVRHVKENQEVHGVAETFLAGHGLASYTALDEELAIVRLEKIQDPLDAQGLTFEDLQRTFEAAAGDGVDRFLANWDTRRDARPAFVAFERDVADELAAPDWPLRLRNRLGLAHYAMPDEPVALMRYTVREVLAEAGKAGAATAFAVPTVLDSRPGPQFFPSPAGLPCGRAMPLRDGYDDAALVAEIVHARITYRRRHLIRLARLGDLPTSTELRTLRNHHLWVLRIAADRDDYGEEIA
jgi:hypothetical protein